MILHNKKTEEQRKLIKHEIATSNNFRAIASTERRQNEIDRGGWGFEKRKKALVAKKDSLEKSLLEMLDAPVGSHDLSIFGSKFESAYRDYNLVMMSIRKIPVW